ncbi:MULTISPECIES: GNAT family N-acetyltransferase [Brevibacterium]|uniref:GNAT family N-acetyltransferase n=1 Tax=Brevibacterium sediminis TaxID=1857024 RepID=A0A5C4X308_9MICO|nr:MULTISPECIES: GNAT family N-acetyltransferase [Brevibacterium]MCS4592795.1 GNAT family N-acetyltransferase [Brevibacterium sediminis]TNM54710.1 GNAT family N-acetyltransferase [Brevibacterium sediminis]UZD63205.1 GNAT family N-acetyltransferase [Brevibacterium sp. JSBI002]
MAVDETIDTEQLSISPLDEVDAREMREFLLDAQANFWGDRDLSGDHDAYWFRQFVTSGLVARYRSEIVGYLLGVIPHDGPAYIHLVAARSDFRHQGIGRHLYQHFIDHSRQLGASSVQATTMPESSGAISFHSSMGFSGELIEDYAGPGNPRVFFELKFPED